MHSSLACECAKQAKAGGYAGFSLHYYGECYGKTNAEIQEIQTNGGHQQHLCVGDQTYDKCDTSAHDHCTGGSRAEGVYAFKTVAAPGKFTELCFLMKPIQRSVTGMHLGGANR